MAPQPFLLSCTHDWGPSEHFCHFEAEVCQLQHLGPPRCALRVRPPGCATAGRFPVPNYDTLGNLGRSFLGP
uniref:Uncharacterized protein n=1 Tax=Aquila chrysaetos chrysaetos TaxID=223781 RepID=A0A663FHM9_AQUCH